MINIILKMLHKKQKEKLKENAAAKLSDLTDALISKAITRGDYLEYAKEYKRAAGSKANPIDLKIYNVLYYYKKDL